ncbi:MAG: 2-aminoethylphosphonate--pyruvate transaminase [bacterium]|nr:2-aminoethylphosphonate--pyruvate transaminase [bacterium]
MRADDRPGGQPNAGDENPYLLLTPGPLSTSRGVRRAMLRDWCTWDDEYNAIVQEIRGELAQLACLKSGAGDEYSAVLMQGSGTFSVESVIGSVIPQDGTLLVLANGAYGRRIAGIAHALGIENIVHDSPEDAPPDLERLDQALRTDPSITHVAVVHCETTTGMLNPIQAIGEIAHKYDCVYIVDAMSSFGGVPLDVRELGIDYLISSANKCIQGVPGFGFTIARHASYQMLAENKIRPRSLSLDLYDQWQTMENLGGKWRYTSPTHTVRAFRQALIELAAEGGIEKRSQRYIANQSALVQGMERAGYPAFLSVENQSPIITAFRYPADPAFEFRGLYERLKSAGFVIYPGKVSTAPTFRVGTIGEVYIEDVQALLAAIGDPSKKSPGM